MGGSEPQFSVNAPLAETGELVAIDLSPHAVDRFIERVRQGLARARAILDVQGLAAMGKVYGQPPSWKRGTRADVAMYLVAGDVAFPLTPSRRDPTRLVATTCITRD